MENFYYAQISSPIGPLNLAASGKGLVALAFHRGQFPPTGNKTMCWTHAPEKVEPYARELSEYFGGNRRKFTFAVDLRGHGRSSAPDCDWTVGDMALDIVRLLRHLGAERAHLIGLSLGGMVAQQVALDYPYAAASLVLVDTVCGVPEDGRTAAADALRFIETHSMAEVAKARITTAFTDAVDPVMRLHLIEAVALNDKVAYERAARAAFSFSVCERLEEIEVPALVVVGEGDRTLPLAWMERLATQIRGARLARLAGAGHISNMERPHEFNRVVLDFLGV